MTNSYEEMMIARAKAYFEMDGGERVLSNDLERYDDLIEFKNGKKISKATGGEGRQSLYLDKELRNFYLHEKSRGPNNNNFRRIDGTSAVGFLLENGFDKRRIPQQLHEIYSHLEDLKSKNKYPVFDR